MKHLLMLNPKKKKQQGLSRGRSEAAAKAEEEASAKAGTGQAIVDYACQFIGNPYVWGGTSLTNGADCSGFVQSVFAHFGISLPRTTWDMENVGTPVSYDQAIAGDLSCMMAMWEYTWETARL